MPERLSEKILRNLMPFYGLNSAVSHTVAAFRADVPLPPYAPPDAAPPSGEAAAEDGPIFITSRFRTGSTLLWQVFERLEGFTAYYEPLNERRWFDPSARGDGVDFSHRGTNDYAVNYDGLADLAEAFDDHWAKGRLALAEIPGDVMMAMYIEALIEAAAERPVLQFNRIDFRLPFIRFAFPEAHIMHLSRAPRDTWRSTLRGIENNPDWNLFLFEPYSRFYLLEWYRDLSLAFPWILRDPKLTHPYELHYLIQRLSDLFARVYANTFVSYEALGTDLTAAMRPLLAAMGREGADLAPLGGLLSPRREGYDHGGDEALYSEIEARVEAELARRLGET